MFICSHYVTPELELHKIVGTIHLDVFVSWVKVQSMLKHTAARGGLKTERMQETGDRLLSQRVMLSP